MLEDRIEAKWIDAKTATGLAKAAALIRMTSLADLTSLHFVITGSQIVPTPADR
jgi:hypothetical protein